MRGLTIALDGLASLRETTSSREIDLTAAVTLAELAGASAVRLALTDELRPVREEDVRDVRRAARRLELRMPASQALIKVVLEGRPDRVVLGGESHDPRFPGGPLDLGARAAALSPVVRALAEGGVPCCALVAPDLDAVKRVHAESVPAIEFHTGAIVDLPPSERAAELTRLGDAVRLASKLGLAIGLGGALSYRSLPELLEACPAVDWVAVGRAAVARALLVGLDRSLRDLRALVE